MANATIDSAEHPPLGRGLARELLDWLPYALAAHFWAQVLFAAL